MKSEIFAAATMKRRVLRMNWRMLCAAFFILHSLFFISCTEQKEHTAPAINDRDSVSMMTSYGINTLISDSGPSGATVLANAKVGGSVCEPPMKPINV